VSTFSNQNIGLLLNYTLSISCICDADCQEMGIVRDCENGYQQCGKCSKGKYYSLIWDCHYCLTGSLNGAPFGSSIALLFLFSFFWKGKYLLHGKENFFYLVQQVLMVGFYQIFWSEEFMVVIKVLSALFLLNIEVIQYECLIQNW
jgi:hypothetical protein